MAQTRNRLPRQLPLPDFADSQCLLQWIEYNQINAKQPRPHVRQERLDSLPTRVDELRLAMAGEQLSINLPSGYCFGEPARDLRKANSLLNPGQSMQIRGNGRHLAYDDPWYTVQTINIAFGPRIDELVFTHQAFTHTFDFSVDLL